MLEIKNKWNVKFIDTEKNLLLEKNKKYFCDNVHQTLEGNKLTAKIISENLK